METAVEPRALGFVRNRWVQLVVGIIGMVMIANLQYGWTLFVGPLDNKYHWGRAAIQVAFTTFVLFETWLVPAEAYLVDRFGPQLVVGVGGLLVGIAWVMNSFADSLTVLYVAAAIGGLGAGAALTVVPIADMIKNSGYESAFLTFGIGQGVLVMLAAFLMRAPHKGEVAETVPTLTQTRRSYSPLGMLKQPVFWVLYVMMTMVATGGLMATAQLGPIAKDFGVGDTAVTIGWITMAALPFALSLDRILN